MIIDVDTSGMTEEQIDRVEDLMIEFSMGEITDEDELFEKICEIRENE